MRIARRVAGMAARWIAVAVLSLLYYTGAALLMLFGGLLAWNGLGPGLDRDPVRAQPVAGAALVALGVLVFIFFPRVVKKVTGHEVPSGPYGGGGCS